ncbi:MAG: hypothetical protein IJ480_07730 [Clostridia bacterium]|nr:hypothetical protein [Clostridia bacterium]
MRRCICLLLALLTVGSLTACGGAADEETTDTGVAAETETETETETEPSALEQLEVKDMGGASYHIFDMNASNGLQVNIPGEELTGEVINDAMINRDSYIEETCNAVLEYTSVPNGEGIEALKKLVQAGDPMYNLAVATIFNLAELVNGQFLYNMMDLPYMELDQKWYSPLMAESLSMGNAMYFTASDLVPSVYQAPTCMFLNLQLYDDYGIDTDIYQLVIDGKWTLDELIAIQKDIDRDLDNDGVWTATEDFFGVGLQPTAETATAFLAGADASFCVKDGDTLTLDINERTIGIMEKLASFCLDIKWVNINDVINDCFKVDKALFLQHKLESAGVHLRDMESDYLVLPTPKADENQDHYISMVSGYCTSFIGVPATAEAEVTGYITEALARYSHDNMRSLAFDMVYKEKTSRDPRTADVLDTLFDNLYIDFSIVYNFGGINDVATQILFQDAPVASSVERKRASIDVAIQKLTEAWNQE